MHSVQWKRSRFFLVFPRNHSLFASWRSCFSRPLEELPDFDEEEQKDEKDKAMGKHTLSIDILGLSGKGYPKFFHGLSPSFPIKMAILRQTHLLLVLSFALRPCWKKVPGEWRCQESEPSRNACARDTQWGPADDLVMCARDWSLQKLRWSRGSRVSFLHLSWMMFL